ncbi:hypothetical protein D3C80_1869210 [compost metagenome]
MRGREVLLEGLVRVPLLADPDDVGRQEVLGKGIVAAARFPAGVGHDLLRRSEVVVDPLRGDFHAGTDGNGVHAQSFIFMVI